ncbi:MAG: hypothetical protein N2376_14340 [Clostridia bacterium]|nr:hypothetical protein [Clostridia bacterium]
MMSGFTNDSENTANAQQDVTLDPSELKLDYPLEFKLMNPDNSSLSEEGTAVFLEDSFKVTTASRKSINFAFRDIVSFEGKDYRIYLTLCSGANLELYCLGRHYEDFLRVLTVLPNNTLKKDILMHEALLFTAEDIQFTYRDAFNNLLAQGECAAQISETALIIATPDGNNSTEAGFQFTFYCDLCQDGYKTQFIEYQTYKKGLLLRGLSRGISIGASLLGANRTGYGVERGADVLSERFEGMSPEWHKEHERAFEMAQNEARGHFHRLSQMPSMGRQWAVNGPSMGRQWVCKSDFNEEEGLCVECAPRMNVEVVHARSQKMVEDIRNKAANTTVFDGKIESKQVTCPPVRETQRSRQVLQQLRRQPVSGQVP